MAVCCCALAGTAACQHCANNPFATDVWTNKTVTVDHVEAKPFGNGIDVCLVCGKPSTIGKPRTNADRIRAMIDKELAELLRDYQCNTCNFIGFCEETDKCKEEIFKWLKEESDGE